MQEDKIKIQGYVGTWYIIDKGYFKGKQVYLLEHEQYGDEAECLVVDNNFKVICQTSDGLNKIEDWI